MKPLFVLALFAFAQNATAVSTSWPSCEITRAVPLEDQFFNGEVQKSQYYQVKPFESQIAAPGQVLIMPPTGGFSDLDYALAQHLCKMGLVVRILDYPQPLGMTTDLKIHDQTTLLVMNTVNLLLKEFPVKTVLVGASLGGIYSSIAFGLSQNSNPQVAKIVAENQLTNLKLIKGAALVVAGAPLADVLAYSSQSRVVQQRMLREKNNIFKNIEEYRQILEEEIQLDPLKLVPSDKAENILLMSSVADDVVLSEAQVKLWQALGQPQKTDYSSGHAGTIVRAYLLHSAEIRRFSQKILNN